VLSLVCYVSLCEGLCAGAGSLSYIKHVDCSRLSTIVIKNVIIIILLAEAVVTPRRKCRRPAVVTPKSYPYP